MESTSLHAFIVGVNVWVDSSQLESLFGCLQLESEAIFANSEQLILIQYLKYLDVFNKKDKLPLIAVNIGFFSAQVPLEGSRPTHKSHTKSFGKQDYMIVFSK